MKANVITLLTDFGLRDNYVGVMKGAMLTILPEATFVDITHSIPAHAVSSASFLLERSYRYFPPGTVHLVVVDPGVGGSRRPIAVKTDKHFFVAPDNGVLSDVLARCDPWEARALEAKEFLRVKLSNTFHGRDLFAPVAAFICKGLPFEKFGPRITDPLITPRENPVLRGSDLAGQVIYIDHYGNLVTNIDEDLLDQTFAGGSASVSILGTTLSPIAKSYAEVGDGELVALVGGFGMLEIAVNRGNAEQRFRASIGTQVVVSKK